MEPNEKSPFLVIANILSPKTCERFVSAFEEQIFPLTRNKHNTNRLITANVDFLKDKLSSQISNIEQQIATHFELTNCTTEQISIEKATEHTDLSSPKVDHCSYINGKWVKNKMIDFTGVLFLSDYGDVVPFDSSFEVFGGKLEFPQWNFGFNPQRGTLVVFPTLPYFITNTSPILVGSLFQLKFSFSTKPTFTFEPNKFKGSYKVWFQGYN